MLGGCLERDPRRRLRDIGDARPDLDAAGRGDSAEPIAPRGALTSWLPSDRQATPWLQMPAAEWNGRLSPDGKWMAYSSNESGRDEVYVQPFPGPGLKRLVSQGGGSNPIWSRDGRELFFRRGDEFLVTSVDTGDGFSTSTPRAMFSGRYRLSGRDFDVSADGTHFVMMQNDDPRTTGSIHVLLDWRAAGSSR